MPDAPEPTEEHPLAPHGPLPTGGTVRPITRWGADVMHRRNERVAAYDDDLQALVADMVATMYAAEGVGLAACQIGVDRAVFVFDCPDESGTHTVGVVCNPVVELPEGNDRNLDDGDEGCLSYPGAFAPCARPDRAMVTGTGPNGEPVRFQGDGLLARCLQHETDHTLGTVFGDRLPTKARKRLAKDHDQVAADFPARLARRMRVGTRNARFQQWLALLDNRTKRHRRGEFLVQGVRPITAAVDHGWEIRALLGDDREQRSDWAHGLWRSAGQALARAERVVLAPDLLAELGGRDEPPELVAVAAIPDDDLERLPADGLVVVLDRPTSPGNVGTVARSADAFGATGLVVTGHAADPYDPRAVRASTGSLFALTVVRAASHRDVLAWAGPAAYRTVGLDEHGPTDVRDADLTGALCLVAGNETTGLAVGWRDGVDALVSIPMRGSASSLNLASAASIVLHEALRQRTPATGGPVTVTIAQLPLPVLRALADGDDEAARRLTPVPLSPYLTGDESRTTWRRRAEQVATAPEDGPWVTGVVLADGVPVGRAGFHAAPDAEGTVEVGYAIDPAHRRRGLARAALAVLLDRAREAPDVRRVLASVGPWNDPSLRMVRSRGFVVIGEQQDDEDGLEIVHALDVTARPTGSAHTRLVLLRGNSGSGKSTVAQILQHGREHDLAVISQDVVRRQLLRVRDEAGSPAVDLLDLATRFALDRGLHVVVEGIMGAWKYGAILRCLARDHVGLTRAYVWDLPFGETVRRHATKGKDDFGEAEMRQWFDPVPGAPGLDEVVFGPEVSLADAVTRIRADAAI